MLIWTQNSLMATKAIQAGFTKEILAFGSRLRYWRKKRGLTQEKLANDANISYSFFNKLENGKKEASLSTILRLSKVLDVDPIVLLLSPERLKQVETSLKLDEYPNDLTKFPIFVEDSVPS